MERKLLNDIVRQLHGTLERVPGIGVRERSCKGRPELLLEIGEKGQSQRVVIGVKRSSGPGMIPKEAAQLREHLDACRASYGILGLPYLTSRTIEACRNEGIGCIDIAGNCLLSLGSIYIEIQGNPNPSPAQQDIKSLFSPKSSRVARVLLSDVGRWWGVREIATVADINPGLVSRLKKRLLEEGLVHERDARICANPSPLLQTWSRNYTYRRNHIQEFYTLDSQIETERKLVEYCRNADIRCALGLFSGASRIAPHVRMNRTFAFVDADLGIIADELGWKPVDSGANVMLLSPYDRGIFLFDRDIDGLPVVSDLQLYLDLKGYRGRGEEGAEFLFNTIIQPQWEREANTNLKK